METVFVEEPKIWYENDNNFVNHPQQNIGKYTGIYSYYFDIENHCFYLRISYIEECIDSPNNDVYVNFNIVNSSREYQFFVDKNGFFNAENNIKAAFDVAVNFEIPSEQGQEIFIGIEFLNKNDRKCNNLIGFSININGQSYDLCKGIELNYQEEVEKSNKVTEESNAKPYAETTQAETKFKYSYSDEVGSTKAERYSYKTESNQKFVYNGEVQEDNSAEYEYEAEEANSAAEIIVKSKNKSRFSFSSKTMLAISGLCVITGVPMIVCGVAIKKRIKRNDKENE